VTATSNIAKADKRADLLVSSRGVVERIRQRNSKMKFWTEGLKKKQYGIQRCVINFLSCSSFPIDKSYLYSSSLPLSLHVAAGSLYESICWARPWCDALVMEWSFRSSVEQRHFAWDKTPPVYDAVVQPHCLDGREPRVVNCMGHFRVKPQPPLPFSPCISGNRLRLQSCTSATLRS
jgi:hypothetical protein